MPQICPVSDLRNYATVLKNVSSGNPVYLTKNGRGAYAIVSLSDYEELSAQKAQSRLMAELEKGRKSGEQNGWLSSEEIKAHFETRFNAD